MKKGTQNRIRKSVQKVAYQGAATRQHRGMRGAPKRQLGTSADLANWAVELALRFNKARASPPRRLAQCILIYFSLPCSPGPQDAQY